MAELSAEDRVTLTAPVAGCAGASAGAVVEGWLTGRAPVGGRQRGR